jgi:hypothetical protein
MMFTIIFPVLNERLRLESGVTRTVEYLRKIAFEDRRRRRTSPVIRRCLRKRICKSRSNDV